MLQVFVGPADIAVYYAATKTLALVNFIYFAVSAASAHRFSEYHVAGEHEKLAAFLAQAIRWTFWPSLALAAAMLALGKPILMLFGPGFADGYHLIVIMSVGLVARSAVGPAERLLNMIGQQKICAAIYGCAFAVNLDPVPRADPAFRADRSGDRDLDRGPRRIRAAVLRHQAPARAACLHLGRPGARA